MKDQKKIGEALMQQALIVRKNAYAPYSRFAVGAALLSQGGQVFLGCNWENAAYPVGLCAERSALAQAISAGCRDFLALALVGGPVESKEDALDECFPCGMCLQALREFCSQDFPIYLFAQGQIRQVTLGQLLPYGFSSDHLPQEE